MSWVELLGLCLIVIGIWLVAFMVVYGLLRSVIALRNRETRHRIRDAIDRWRY